MVDFTALHYAAQNNHVDTVKLLLEKGANVNIKPKTGKMPLDIAIQLNKHPNIKSKHCSDKYGSDYSNIIQLLTEYGETPAISTLPATLLASNGQTEQGNEEESNGNRANPTLG